MPRPRKAMPSSPPTLTTSRTWVASSACVQWMVGHCSPESSSCAPGSRVIDAPSRASATTRPSSSLGSQPYRSASPRSTASMPCGPEKGAALPVARSTATFSYSVPILQRSRGLPAPWNCSTSWSTDSIGTACALAWKSVIGAGVTFSQALPLSQGKSRARRSPISQVDAPRRGTRHPRTSRRQGRSRRALSPGVQVGPLPTPERVDRDRSRAGQHERRGHREIAQVALEAVTLSRHVEPVQEEAVLDVHQEDCAGHDGRDPEGAEACETTEEDAQAAEELGRDHEHRHGCRHALLGEGLDRAAEPRATPPAEHLLRPVREEDHPQREPDDERSQACHASLLRRPGERRRQNVITPRATSPFSIAVNASLTWAIL